MIDPQHHNPRPGFFFESGQGPRVAVYCCECTSFYVKSFGSHDEVQAFKSGGSFRRASNCPYDRSYSSYCKHYEAICVGEAPLRMVAWLEGDQSDWPKCPEDFIEGAV